MGRICYRLRHLPIGNFTIWCHVTGKVIKWVLGRVFLPVGGSGYLVGI